MTYSVESSTICQSIFIVHNSSSRSNFVDANTFSIRSENNSDILEDLTPSPHKWDNPAAPDTSGIREHSCRFKVKLTNAAYSNATLSSSVTEVKVKISACKITDFSYNLSFNLRNSFTILTGT
jgi:hypothetical protein